VNLSASDLALIVIAAALVVAVLFGFNITA
jgi:hypothetical protein